MKFIKTKIPEVMIIEPKVWTDHRGYFFESFRYDIFKEQIGTINFVQDNESKSTYGVLRGLHYQLPPYAQSKLVRVIKGRIWDVVVDIRKGSVTFGRYIGVELSEDNKKMIFIPRGFAHGFVILSDEAVFNYKVDNYYSKEHDRGVAFYEPSLKIDWKVPHSDIVLSDKDKTLPILQNAQLFDLKERL